MLCTAQTILRSGRFSYDRPTLFVGLSERILCCYLNYAKLDFRTTTRQHLRQSVSTLERGKLTLLYLEVSEIPREITTPCIVSNHGALVIAFRVIRCVVAHVQYLNSSQTMDFRSHNTIFCQSCATNSCMGTACSANVEENTTAEKGVKDPRQSVGVPARWCSSEMQWWKKNERVE